MRGVPVYFAGATCRSGVLAESLAPDKVFVFSHPLTENPVKAGFWGSLPGLSLGS
jgi:hypothetical protein